MYIAELLFTQDILPILLTSIAFAVTLSILARRSILDSRQKRIGQCQPVQAGVALPLLPTAKGAYDVLPPVASVTVVAESNEIDIHLGLESARQRTSLREAVRSKPKLVNSLPPADR